eukprot:TRINITY_DN129_c0_g6_i2.p1 TRINITY_DN129_c0_g6~~TRINITY_DN129_c0_g6_i2.p1  ORF type:complete len:175 (-),score=71.03 TRINITY_DN129_c0_g6_i2:52-576(-)
MCIRDRVSTQSTWDINYIREFMGFKRFVQAGRVAYINYGVDHGKVCVIVEVINSTRVLVDGPTLGVPRQVISLRRLALTDHLLKVAKGIHTKSLEAEIKKADLVKKIGESSWAKKLAAQKRRAELNDFERFQVMMLKRQKAYLVNKDVAQAHSKGAKKAKKAAKPKEAKSSQQP